MVLLLPDPLSVNVTIGDPDPLAASPVEGEAATWLRAGTGQRLVRTQERLYSALGPRARWHEGRGREGEIEPFPLSRSEAQVTAYGKHNKNMARRRRGCPAKACVEPPTPGRQRCWPVRGEPSAAGRAERRRTGRRRPLWERKGTPCVPGSRRHGISAAFGICLLAGPAGSGDISASPPRL